MPVIKSKIKTSSEDYKRNFDNMSSLVEKLKNDVKHVRDERNEKARGKYLAQGKLPARQRLELLLDSNTPFLELSPMAAYNMYDNEAPQAGIITGIGMVGGRETLITCNDAMVKGGALYPVSVKKFLRAQQVAMENHLPSVYLVDSGGAFLPLQSEIFPDMYHGGRIFYNQAIQSARGLTQIAVVLGLCTAGAAYIPAMSDYVVIARGTGAIFLGGPPLVKAATGEEVTADELGGADVHCRISGVADYIAENDEHAIEIARQLMLDLPHPPKTERDTRKPEEPLYDQEELYGIVPVDLSRQYDVREVIARIVDNSQFNEFKADYGTTLVTGFARIYGYTVGILGNNGVLFSESSLKGSQFIQICNKLGIPLVFLQNISGFIVGKKFEHLGITKDGSKMVNAVANSTVPKFTVIIGGSFGAGNYAMCGRAYGARLLWMWPNSRISVMGGEQAAGVLVQVKLEEMKRKNQKISPEEIEALKKVIISRYSEESSAYYSTARIWDDGIIDPVDTRKVLGLGISMSLNAPMEEAKFGVFRM